MIRTAILLPVLALAACNTAPDVSATNASVEDVAAKVDAATGGKSLVSPGRWETSVKVENLGVPGMAPALAERMKKGHGMTGGRTVVTCLSEADANKPKENFFGGDAAKGCRYDKFSMAGGAIDAAFQCDQGGVKQQMTMKGQYTPDAYSLTMTSVGAGGPGTPMAGVTMTMKVDGKRTGACTGDEINKKGAAPAG